MAVWNNNAVTSRAIAKGQTKTQVEKQVKELKGRGYVPLMGIKEEISPGGRSFFVCVMENPELKAELIRRKNPSQ